MNTPKKAIVKGYNTYIIIIPIYYEYENKPAYRTVYKGSKEDCKKVFESFPDTLTATEEENKTNRYWKHKEMMHAFENGNFRKFERIRKQYYF